MPILINANQSHDRKERQVKARHKKGNGLKQKDQKSCNHHGSLGKRSPIQPKGHHHKNHHDKSALGGNGGA